LLLQAMDILQRPIAAWLRKKGHEVWSGNHCFSEGKTACSYRCLAPQTWSVPDFVRTDLRTVRLAIACGDRRDRAMHPRKAQAVTRPARWKKDNEQAWKDDWNGPSDTASRHRQEAIAVTAPCAPRKLQARTIHLVREENKRAWDGAICSLGRGRVPGKRLQGNRWMGG
jgi:hypothetical protein